MLVFPPPGLLVSSHSDDGDMHAFRVISESGVPDAPNDNVMWSMAADPVPGRESISRLNIDLPSSSAEALVGPCEDVLLRALELENSRFRGLVTLPRRGSMIGDVDVGSVSELADGCPDDDPRSPGSGGRGTRGWWNDRCLRADLLDE